MTILKGCFNSVEDVFEQFNVSEEQQKDVELLYAQYDSECYEGSAFVLFARKGKLYEVNGSHCSCFGLEDQWRPEETFLEALNKRDWFVDAPEAEVFQSVKRWQRRESARKRRKAGK